MEQNSSLSRNTLFQIVESSVDAIIVINTKGEIVYVNIATALMFRYTKEQMQGKNVSMLMSNPDAKNHDTYINNYLETAKPKIIGIGREVICKKKDETLFSCLLSISEVKSEGVHLFTGIIHDISNLKEVENKLKDINKNLEARVEDRTEKLNDAVNKLLAFNTELKTENTLRKKTEVALKKSQNELKEALSKEKELNELKSRFVSMASHEFRTPLSTILSSTNLLQKYIEAGVLNKTESHINKITNAVNHLNEVLSDFLLVGKWEEGKINIEISQFSWIELVKELKDIVEINLKPEQILTIDNVDVYFNSDYNLIKNSLINIISNAIKYSNDGREIKIKIELLEKVAIIKVKDKGFGIPEHDQTQIFERFFRASNISNIEGTGLGLSIVKMYVEKLQGNISFTSELGKGTIFTLQIPLNLNTNE